MAETQAKSDANPTRRWWRFSMRTMLLAVTLVCVVLAGYQWWLGHRVRRLAGDYGSNRHLRVGELKKALKLPRFEGDEILERYAAASPRMVWFPEAGVFLSVEEWVSRGDGPAPDALLHLSRGNDPRDAYQILYAEWDFVELVGQEGNRLELVFSIADELADELGVERGQVWRGRYELAAFLLAMTGDSPRPLISLSDKTRWLLEQAEPVGEVEAVPGGEGAR